MRRTDLEDGRLDTGVAQEVHEEAAAHVRDTKVFDVPAVDEFLERLPRLPQGDRVMFDLALPIEEPPGRVALIRGDICQGDG